MDKPSSLLGTLNPGGCRRVAGEIPFPLPHPSGFGAQQLLAHPSKGQAGGTSTSITSREPQPQDCPMAGRGGTVASGARLELLLWD